MFVIIQRHEELAIKTIQPGAAAQNNTKLSDGIAVIWGFAEATFFFIIPDVFTSYRALESWHAGFRACLMALAGALVGGSLMYAAAAGQPAAALRFVDHVPGVTNEVIDNTRQSYRQDGNATILYGPIKTIPYKVISVLAPSEGVSYFEFILISVPARLARFVLVTAVAAGLSYSLRKYLTMRIRLWIFAGSWTVTYILYFAFHWI